MRAHDSRSLPVYRHSMIFLKMHLHNWLRTTALRAYST